MQFCNNYCALLYASCSTVSTCTCKPITTCWEVIGCPSIDWALCVRASFSLGLWYDSSVCLSRFFFVPFTRKNHAVWVKAQGITRWRHLAHLLSVENLRSSGDSLSYSKIYSTSMFEWWSDPLCTNACFWFFFFFQGDQNTKQKKKILSKNHHIIEVDA